jgi:hypothetical protein
VEAPIKELRISSSSSRHKLRREALVAKTLRRDVKAVLDGAVEIAKHVKFRPLNARMFKLVCQELGNKFFLRVLKLRSEIYPLFIEQPFFLFLTFG